MISGSIDPLVVLGDEIDEAFYGFGFWDIEFYRLFADVEIDFSWGTTDVAEIGIGHFSWAIDDASHDGDPNTFEVACGCSDFLSCILKVE